MARKTTITKEILEKEYYENKLNQREIEEKYGIGRGYVYVLMKKYGFKVTYYKDILTKGVLEKEYYENKLTQKEIAAKYNIGQAYVSKLMKKYKLDIIRNRFRKINFDNKADLAYILGVSLGDGSPRWRKRGGYYMFCDRIKVSSYEFIQSVSAALGRIGLNNKICESDGMYMIYYSSNEFGRWYNDIVNNINSFLELLSSDKCKWAFLRGFYEAEGGCYDKVNRNGYYSLDVSFSNINVYLIFFVGLLIFYLGYSVRLYDRGDIFVLYLLGSSHDKAEFMIKLNPCIKRVQDTMWWQENMVTLKNKLLEKL